jgi:hypothetical protein
MLQLLVMLRVDGGLVDEHVVAVLVDDHEVVGNRQEGVANRQESLEDGLVDGGQEVDVLCAPVVHHVLHDAASSDVVKVSSDGQDDSNQLVQEIPLSRR